MEYAERLPVRRISGKSQEDTEDMVAREMSLIIVLNRRKLSTVSCSPAALDYLAIGFLASEGLIRSQGQIKKIAVDVKRGTVRVEAETGSESAAPPPPKTESPMKISAPQVWALVKNFQQRCRVFRATGGVHAAALADDKSIRLFHEDIGRHNTIDKVFGECLLQDIATADHVLITSGRVSAEILLKAARMGIAIIISKSAPTSLGVKLAGERGITVIGFVRGQRMNIYTNAWRVTNG